MSQHETLEFFGWWFLVCMPICLLILRLYGRWYYRRLTDRRKTEVLRQIKLLEINRDLRTKLDDLTNRAARIERP